MTDLRGEAVELLASKVDDHGWSPAQVATVAAGGLPDEVHDATRFVRARLAAETAAPTVGRPPRGSAWERIEDPDDGWAAPEPDRQVEGTCAAEGCTAPIAVVEMDGTAWCAQHPVAREAAS